MYKKTLKSMIALGDSESVEVVYNLIFRNALYSFECYKVGSEKEDSTYNYYYVENITEDEGKAETFLHQMVKGSVLPVHIIDMVNDCLYA